jgi:hypothetical protein
MSDKQSKIVFNGKQYDARTGKQTGIAKEVVTRPKAVPKKWRLALLAIGGLLLGIVILSALQTQFRTRKGSDEFINHQDAIAAYNQAVADTGLGVANTTPSVSEPYFQLQNQHGFYDLTLRDLTPFPEKAWMLERGTVTGTYKATVDSITSTPPNMAKSGWDGGANRYADITFQAAAATRQRKLENITQRASQPNCINDPACRAEQDQLAKDLNDQPLQIAQHFTKDLYWVDVSYEGYPDDSSINISVTMMYGCKTGLSCPVRN